MRATSRDPRAHLGAGWAFPVTPANGRLRYARWEEDIEQAIRIILLTARNERVMQPDFGAGLPNFVFEPNSPQTRRAIEEDVRRALIDWEPRIELQAVRVDADEVTPNLLLIHVDFLVRATNTFYNRVYPFYLAEGGA